MTAGDSGGRKVMSLSDLPQAIEPQRDLWPQIEARLNEIQAAAPPDTGAKLIPPYQSRARLRWLAAAAMVASVAVGVWLGRSVLPGTQPGPMTAAVPGNVAAAPDAPTAIDAAYLTDARYQHQRAALLRTLQAQLATMPPAGRAKVMGSLTAIQKAKQDLQEALGKDPGNALLQELLVDTYQDEMRVLTDVHEASDAGKGI
jgi:hypothetical protein